MVLRMGVLMLLAFACLLYMCGVMLSLAYCYDAHGARGTGPDWADTFMILAWPLAALVLFSLMAGKMSR